MGRKQGYDFENLVHRTKYDRTASLASWLYKNLEVNHCGNVNLSITNNYENYNLDEKQLRAKLGRDYDLYVKCMEVIRGK